MSNEAELLEKFLDWKEKQKSLRYRVSVRVIGAFKIGIRLQVNFFKNKTNTKENRLPPLFDNKILSEDLFVELTTILGRRASLFRSRLQSKIGYVLNAVQFYNYCTQSGPQSMRYRLPEGLSISESNLLKIVQENFTLPAALSGRATSRDFRIPFSSNKKSKEPVSDQWIKSLLKQGEFYFSLLVASQEKRVQRDFEISKDLTAKHLYVSKADGSLLMQSRMSEIPAMIVYLLSRSPDRLFTVKEVIQGIKLGFSMPLESLVFKRLSYLNLRSGSKTPFKPELFFRIEKRKYRILPNLKIDLK